MFPETITPTSIRVLRAVRGNWLETEGSSSFIAASSGVDVTFSKILAHHRLRVGLSGDDTTRARVSIPGRLLYNDRRAVLANLTRQNAAK